MMTSKDAIYIFKKEHPDLKVKRCTEFKGDFIIQTDENRFDPFYRITKSGKILYFTPAEDLEYFDYIK